MPLGIQSTVQVDDKIFTVETETRGADHPLLDTTVYAQGRVLYRRVKSYQDLLDSPATPDVQSSVKELKCNIAELCRISAQEF